MGGAKVAVAEPIRRKARARKLVASAVGAAAEMIGPIASGEEIVGLTNGQFSLIDVIEHVLASTGPADVAVSTWTMGIYDQERAKQFYSDGRIRRARWIVDPSMFGRRPELAGSLIQAFGLDAFRAVNTHAKFATIVGDELAVCLRSSMNLNPNRRLENFDLSADAEMCRWFNRFVDDVFARVDEKNTSQSEAVFAEILSAFETAKPEVTLPLGKIASAKEMGRDLRRVFD